MSKDSKTPQAFPYSGEGDELNYSKGMTLRDYAAIKAMQGDLVSGVHPDNFDATAKRAYKMADAMLKARQA
jgi:hypothetical protein